MDKKKNIGLAIAVVILIGTLIIPAPEGLNVAGKNALGLLLAGIVLWITEAVPLGISAMLLMILLPLYGVTEKLAIVFKDFMSPVIFFVIATFAITTVIMKTPLATRITGKILDWAGDDSKKLVLGFCIAAALLSTVTSNVPTCALFMALGLTVLECTGGKPGKSNLGKCLMIGIPFATMIGGGGTPAGTSINIMAIGLLEQAANVQISFLDWMIMAMPMVIIMVPIAWFTIVTVFKPEPIKQSDLVSLKKTIDDLGPMSSQEKKVITIIAVMLVLWVASTWFPVLDTTMVAIAGLVVMFLPGVNVITWDDFVAGVSWNIILLIGGVSALASGILSTGAASWLVTATMSGAAGWGATITTLGASALMTLMHVLVPVGPAIVGMATPPIAGLAVISGASAAALTVMVAFMAAITFILPIDCVPLLTYGKGYYTMPDFVKAGIVPTIALILYCTFLLPHLAVLVGL